MFLNCVINAELCEYLQNQWIVNFNRVTLYYVSVISIKLLFLKIPSECQRTVGARLKGKHLTGKAMEWIQKTKVYSWQHARFLTTHRSKPNSPTERVKVMKGNFKKERKWPMNINNQWHGKGQGCVHKDKKDVVLTWSLDTSNCNWNRLNQLKLKKKERKFNIRIQDI